VALTGITLSLAARAAEPETVHAEDVLLDIDEASAMMRTSKDSLYKKRKRLRLGFQDPLDKKIKFTRAELQAHIRKHRGRP
jgi:hypothetical protein